MRIILGAIVGGIVGFLTVYISKEGWDFTFLYHLATPTIICTFFIILFIIIKSILLRQELIHLSNLEVKGEEEDLLDDKIYEKTRLFSSYISIGGVLTLSTLATVAILDYEPPYIIIALVLVTIITCIQYLLPSLYTKIYPDRPYPSFNDPNYAEKILEMADEGERQIILVALYKSYNLISMLATFGIVASLIYSILTNTSQLFSIIMLTIILIASNWKYSKSIIKRN